AEHLPATVGIAVDGRLVAQPAIERIRVFEDSAGGRRVVERFGHDRLSVFLRCRAVERFLYCCSVMDVTLTDDQQLLRATAASLADDLATAHADALADVPADLTTPPVHV